MFGHTTVSHRLESGCFIGMLRILHLLRSSEQCACETVYWARVGRGNS